MDKETLSVLQALGAWIERTANDKMATPEAVLALPQVAQVYFETYCSLSSAPPATKASNTSSMN